MGRVKGQEGSVRAVPGGSGRWQARLPARLDPYRRPLPHTFESEQTARRALRMAIADLDRRRTPVPTGRPGRPIRRVRDVLADYIDARETSSLAPIAIKTSRDYRSVLVVHVCRPRADLGRVPVHLLTGRDLRAWMEDLAADGVGPSTIANARRVLGAALAWETREGRLHSSPMAHVRLETSKARRAATQVADPVLLPSWTEFAALVQAPRRETDRPLIALLGWSGLRWSEAISLDEQAVWRDRPQITVRRVIVRRTKREVARQPAPSGAVHPYWIQEPPKSGLTATVPLPGPLWHRLVELADARAMEVALPEPAGRLLFRRPPAERPRGHGIGLLDNTNFRRDVWIPARQAAGLAGDESRPSLDPRRYPIKVKDLRAFAASVLLDSGCSLTEAALLLRHSHEATTERHYARAMQERAYDRARRDVQVDRGARLAERLDALWGAWATRFPRTVDAVGIDSTYVDDLLTKASSFG